MPLHAQAPHPLLAAALLVAALIVAPAFRASESGSAFPLWDGKEPVASYANRVGLSPTKTITLPGGVAMDFVLLPAGQFVMGSPEPAPPRATVGDSERFVHLGCGALIVLLCALAVRCWKLNRFSFSLRWLILFVLATGAFVGGTVRRVFAEREAVRHNAELEVFKALPDDEKPAHSVTLTRPFYLGKCTVTQEQYAALLGQNPSLFSGANLPVVTVSWNDAQVFCQKLGAWLGNTAGEVRLPTEAQWEFACRAGTRTRFYSGDSERDLDAVAWYDANSKGTTHPVGKKDPNAFGLYDMHGNVFQWCEDAYSNVYTMADAFDPLGKDGSDRVVRGGSWFGDQKHCRSAYRNYHAPEDRYAVLGFRVTIAIPPAKTYVVPK